MSLVKISPMRILTLAGAALLGLALLAPFAPAQANEGLAPLQFKDDSGNLPSVQRGARNFMNYCSGCHSMKYLRYSRMGTDLGLSADQLKQNLMFTSDKPGDTIVNAMPAAAAGTWFGQIPPDLSLETKVRGADWVYSYLLSFYLDDKRPMGVNNLYLPGVSMPHVLGALQGWQVKEEAPAGEAAHHGEGEELKLAEPGSLSPEEYKAFVADLVNFMAYAAEPTTSQRLHTGGRVMIYLLVLLVLTYLLKKEYWRDIH